MGRVINRNDRAALTQLSKSVSASYVILKDINNQVKELGAPVAYDYMSNADTFETIASLLGQVPYWAEEYRSMYKGAAGMKFENFKIFLENKTKDNKDPLLQAALQKAKEYASANKSSNVSSNRPGPTKGLF